MKTVGLLVFSCLCSVASGCLVVDGYFSHAELRGTKRARRLSAARGQPRLALAPARIRVQP